jgi:hypothetical protein
LDGARGFAIGCHLLRPLGSITAPYLEAAVGHAFAHGATSVEAYPHVADPCDYMGRTALYAQAGFEHVRDANKRALVRRRRSRS